MYTINDITAILDQPHETDDDYNTMRANLLAAINGGLTEHAEVLKSRDSFQTENERLRQNNLTLYNQVEKQYTQPPKAEEEEDNKPNHEEMVRKNQELYRGLI